MIWNENISLEVLNQLDKATLVNHLGIKITEIGDDYLKGTMPVDERTHQPYGLLHGGASCVLSETLGSVASVFATKDRINLKVVGVEINANHLRSVSSGYVTGICRPIKLGRKLMVWNTDIFDESDRLICTSRLTTMILSE